MLDGAFVIKRLQKGEQKALRQFVATIVVVTGDSDIVPAFKFARREGVRVYLDLLGSTHVKRDLTAHADLIL